MLLAFQTLAVVGSAAFAGVMLAIGLILGVFWRGMPPADFLAWFQEHSHLVMRTIPLVVVPTLIGLGGSVWLSWADAAVRGWWLAALGCVAAILALTATYFFPINAAFVTGSLPVESVPTKLDAWLSVHWIRIALAVLAATFGLVAATR